MAERKPVLEMRGISKHFGAVRALSNVDFEVFGSEVVGLVGDNGAGKSTLIKALSGIQPADEGEIYLEGQRVAIHVPRDATALGISTVYQDLALCDNLDVIGNLFLGRETVRSAVPHVIEPIDEAGMERRAIDVLQTLSVNIPDVRTPIASLSGGQRQSVAVARSVMWNAKIVVLDEPTAALGVAQTRQVLDLIKRLRQQGLAVVMISHNLPNIFEVCDRIEVLRQGRNAGSFSVANTSLEEIVARINGVEFGTGARMAAPTVATKGERQ